jgi:hypothetical protein|tara:strand:+ start:365 stop:571 length:207 start_codon:yes stop_codon:yes gene_type:complete
MSRVIKAVLTFGIGANGTEVVVYPNSYDMSENTIPASRRVSISRKQADTIREVQEVMSKYRELENEQS